MCGITGFFDLKDGTSKEVLDKMTDSLAHRGPDGESTEFFEKDGIQIGLGHRRLSVIDLTECGAQPMRLDSLWITFNGEIYNYRAIRDELTHLGHRFISNSDTEIILHAFRQWGTACLDRFRGMFAFLIVDIESFDVFCVRDRAGVKPFYFYAEDGLFLFSSELKAFHRHPRFRKEIDDNAVRMYMMFGNIPAPHSIFKNTFKIKPGHFLKFNIRDLISNAHVFSQVQYWNVYDAYNQPKLDIPFLEARRKTEEVLTDAFRLRMVSDVPVGVFLSGGFDSVCVTALLQKDSERRLKTFTVAVPDIGLNEAPFAKEIAAHLGTDHTEVNCTSKEALELFDELPYYYDEPFGDASAIPTSLVSKVARQNVTVALSADGGDEVFAGYNRYDYLMGLRSKLEKVPAFLRIFVAGAMNQVNPDRIPVLGKKPNFSNRFRKLKRLLKDPTPEQIMWSLSAQYEESEIKKLLVHDTSMPELPYHSRELDDLGYSPLSYMMAIDYQTYLPDDILTKVDRATMRFSIEGREPFLDHKIIEWAARLPDEFKYRDGIKKYILKEIVYQYLPKELMNRPKMGFAIPYENWMKNELRSKLDYYLSFEKLKKQGIFRPEEVMRIKELFLNGRDELGMKVWHLLMFQMWYGRWMG